MQNGICSLCHAYGSLALSHIMPKFVINLLKENSRLRSNERPNVPIQDGKKIPLLCSSCEGLLSEFERQAYEHIFAPLNNSGHSIKLIRYGPWALKFAVSVSWRVLLYYNQYGLPHISKEQKAETVEASETWRKFLLGELPNPGQFEQHLLPLNLINSVNGFKPSPFLNRYIMLTSHMEVVYSSTSVAVLTKMGNMLLYGLIHSHGSNLWKGTKLHLKSGNIKIAGTYVIPPEIFDYLNERANQAANVLASVSEMQRKSIKENIVHKTEEIIDSNVFKAINQDVIQSGQEAFRITRSL